MYFLFHIFHLLSHFLTYSKGTSEVDSGSSYKELDNICVKISGGLELCEAEDSTMGGTY